MRAVPDTPIALRKFEPDDVDALWSFRNDPSASSMLVGLSIGYSRQDLREWIERHRSLPDEVLFAMVDLQSRVCVGHVGLYQIDYRVRKAQFGILIGDSELRGLGVGTKVSAFMLDFGFDQLNLNKIFVSALATNHRVLAMNRRLGFIHEGTARQDTWKDGQFIDVVTMSILRSEWAERAQ